MGISTLRDRVCMTAAMLVLEPIFEADLPPEQYAYRPGRNALIEKSIKCFSQCDLIRYGAGWNVGALGHLAPAYWERCMFDNEDDARKAFG